MKKTLLVGGLLALLLAGSTIAAWAQSHDPFYDWPTGCDVGTLDAIEEASPNVDYRTACEQFLACAVAGREWNVCQFEVAGSFLEICEADDAHCRNEALLHVAALTIYGPGDYVDWQGSCWWDEGSNQFREVVRQFSTGDYGEAARLLAQLVEAQQCGNHPMVKYVEGLIAEIRGQREAALEAYSQSVALSERKLTPAMYSRGLLLGELGRATEASLEAERLRRFLAIAAPVVLPVMTPLIEKYPLDLSPFVTWMAYPVGKVIPDAIGDQMWDLTLDPPIPVEIADYPDLDLMAVTGFPSVRGPSHAAALSMALLYQQSEEAEFGFRGNRSLVEGPHIESRYVGWMLDVQASENLLLVTQSDSGFEWGWTTTYLVVSPDAPDPRANFGTRTCEGGVLSLVGPGLIVSGNPYGLYLQAQPGEDIRGLERMEYALISGVPVCIGSDAWWYATTRDGQSGWVRENQGNNYWLTRNYMQRQRWMYCPPALPSRLFAYDDVLVTEATGAGQLRETPGSEAALLTTLSPGQIAEVGSERTCVDGQVWWRVSTEDGQSGYMAEADADTYFLEPVPEVGP